ncbi:NnrS family protein [Mesorhizobium sp. CC13]|uniref:NnrS family protein n=1 Tax=Mesorhizobium sp. CC13 TaxID=3029194 RepID=UPI0032655E03
MKSERGAPFRPFFMLAALDAMLGGAVWALPAEIIVLSVRSAGNWHRHVVLFGTLPAILAGFLLTALPRWTGQKPVPPVVTWRLVGVWVLGRMVFVLVDQMTGSALFALFLLLVMLVLARSMRVGRDRRNLKVLALLMLYWTAMLLIIVGWQAELATRTALAAIVGLVMVIGGRVVPTLTEAYLQSGAQGAEIARARVETAAALAAVGALAAWTAAPGSWLAAIACIAAACLQLGRLAAWRGWRSRRSAAILVLHIGYLWIVVGFMLAAASSFLPAIVGPAAAVHTWTVGAVGTMAMGIMASMVRKHAGRAFAASIPATAAFVAMSSAAVLRQVVEFSPALPYALQLSGICWVAAWALFIVFSCSVGGLRGAVSCVRRQRSCSRYSRHV